MRKELKMNEVAKLEYIEKICHLSEQQISCLLAMLPASLKKSLEEGRITKLDAVAIQLEKEHAFLFEWRLAVSESGSTHRHPISNYTIAH